MMLFSLYYEKEKKLHDCGRRKEKVLEKTRREEAVKGERKRKVNIYDESLDRRHWK